MEGEPWTTFICSKQHENLSLCHRYMNCGAWRLWVLKEDEARPSGSAKLTHFPY